jgi:hypothetical protein
MRAISAKRRHDVENGARMVRMPAARSSAITGASPVIYGWAPLAGGHGCRDLRRPLNRRSPPHDLGVALTDGLGECPSAVNHASPSKCRRGHEAGAATACIDDACALDPKAGLPERGVELGCGRWWTNKLPASPPWRSGLFQNRRISHAEH